MISLIFFFTCSPTQCPSESRQGSFFNGHIFLMMGVAALIMRFGNHSTQPVCVECGPGKAFALKQLCLVTLYSYFTKVTILLTRWIVYLRIFEGSWRCSLSSSQHLRPPELRLLGFWHLIYLISIDCLQFNC